MGGFGGCRFCGSLIESSAFAKRRSSACFQARSSRAPALLDRSGLLWLARCQLRQRCSGRPACRYRLSESACVKRSHGTAEATNSYGRKVIASLILESSGVKFAQAKRDDVPRIAQIDIVPLSCIGPTMHMRCARDTNHRRLSPCVHAKKRTILRLKTDGGSIICYLENMQLLERESR